MIKRIFNLPSGMSIAADVSGPDDGPGVILLHGGGQTRHSWKNCRASLSARGYRACSMDSRGHGESGWASDGNYQLSAMVDDLAAVVDQFGGAPALVGASMGGLTALAALGEARCEASALILVDVTPRIDQAGAQRIGQFMAGNPDGFASLEDVADTISAYNPHRARPASLEGLRRNLTERVGRFYWLWDPAFLGTQQFSTEHLGEQLDAAARNITVPTLLVRGGVSDLVGEEQVNHFRELMPEAEYLNVAGAGHMVAGDRNDAFNAGVIAFLDQLARL